MTSHARGGRSRTMPIEPRSLRHRPLAERTPNRARRARTLAHGRVDGQLSWDRCIDDGLLDALVDGRSARRRRRLLDRAVRSLRHRLLRHIVTGILARSCGSPGQVLLLPVAVLRRPSVASLVVPRRLPHPSLPRSGGTLFRTVAPPSIALRAHANVHAASSTRKLPPNIRRCAHTGPRRAGFSTTTPTSVIRTSGA